MKFGGFATNGFELTLNSGGFNSHSYGGCNDNNFRDESKSMSEAEGQLLIGTWVANLKRGWSGNPVTVKEMHEALDNCKTESLTYDERLAEFKTHFSDPKHEKE